MSVFEPETKSYVTARTYAYCTFIAMTQFSLFFSAAALFKANRICTLLSKQQPPKSQEKTDRKTRAGEETELKTHVNGIAEISFHAL